MRAPNKKIPLIYRMRLKRMRTKLNAEIERLYRLVGELNGMLYLKEEEGEPEELTLNNYGDNVEEGDE